MKPSDLKCIKCGESLSLVKGLSEMDEQGLQYPKCYAVYLVTLEVGAVRYLNEEGNWVRLR